MVAIRKKESEIVLVVQKRQSDCPLIDLLTKSPWPLSIEDIAGVLDVDEITAVLALRLLRDAGRARLTSDGKWEIH